MKTVLKPFSTLSYDSVGTLKEKLDKLTDKGILKFYLFVEHLPEDDETKKHIHLYCIPARRLDCDLLKCYLNSTIVRISCFFDFYLYGLHNELYLSAKGQKRKYHYCANDFIRNDERQFEELLRQWYIIK